MQIIRPAKKECYHDFHQRTAAHAPPPHLRRLRIACRACLYRMGRRRCTGEWADQYRRHSCRGKRRTGRGEIRCAVHHHHHGGGHREETGEVRRGRHLQRGRRHAHRRRDGTRRHRHPQERLAPHAHPRRRHARPRRHREIPRRREHRAHRAPNTARTPSAASSTSSRKRQDKSRVSP